MSIRKCCGYVSTWLNNCPYLQHAAQTNAAVEFTNLLPFVGSHRERGRNALISVRFWEIATYPYPNPTFCPNGGGRWEVSQNIILLQVLIINLKETNLGVVLHNQLRKRQFWVLSSIFSSFPSFTHSLSNNCLHKNVGILSCAAQVIPE